MPLHKSEAIWRGTIKEGAGPTIKRIELDCEATVPAVGDAEFQGVAAHAKVECPVSKALAAVPEIVLSAKLVG